MWVLFFAVGTMIDSYSTKLELPPLSPNPLNPSPLLPNHKSTNQSTASPPQVSQSQHSITTTGKAIAAQHYHSR